MDWSQLDATTISLLGFAPSRILQHSDWYVTVGLRGFFSLPCVQHACAAGTTYMISANSWSVPQAYSVCAALPMHDSSGKVVVSLMVPPGGGGIARPQRSDWQRFGINSALGLAVLVVAAGAGLLCSRSFRRRGGSSGALAAAEMELADSSLSYAKLN